MRVKNGSGNGKTEIGGAVCILLAVFCSFTAFGQRPDLGEDAGDLGYAPGEILVVFKPGVGHARVEGARQNLGATAIKVIPKVNVHHWRLAQGPGLEKTLERLLKNPDIKYAEPNWVYSYDGFLGDLNNPTDPSFIPRPGWEAFGVQEHLRQDDPVSRNIGAEEAWDNSPKGDGVVVAVLDSGIDLDHPDLDGNLVAGRNCLRPNKPPDDDVGHGTHVAGIIAAQINNAGDQLLGTAALDPSLGDGVVGVAPAAKIMPVKVGDANGIPTDAIVDGIVFAADNGAHIINMSFGSSVFSQSIQDALAYAYQTKGVLAVAAAGNDSVDDPRYPAASQYTLAVAAVTSGDLCAGFSNYGLWVDIAAPGVDILSTLIDDDRSKGESGGYARKSGTSMAAPVVAGVAALVKSQYPSLSADEFAAQVLACAFNIDAENPGRIGELGAGRVDAATAVSAISAPVVISTLIQLPDQAVEVAVKFSHVMNASLEGEPGFANSVFNPADYGLLHLGEDGALGGGDDAWVPLGVVSSSYGPFPGAGVSISSAPDVQAGNYILYVFSDGVQSAAGEFLGAEYSREFHWEPNRWIVESIQEGGAEWTDVAFSQDGTPFVAYNSFSGTLTGILFAHFNGNNWQYEVVDTGGGYYVDLEYDPSTNQATAIYESPNHVLKFARRIGPDNWTVEDVANDSYEGLSLAYDDSGHPAVIYRNAVSESHLVFFDGSTWNDEGVVDPAATKIQTIAWDPDDQHFAIACQVVSPTDQLRYIKRLSPSSFGSEVVRESPRVGSGARLAFDPVTGNPSIFHGSGAYLTTWNGSIWETEDVSQVLGDPPDQDYGGKDFTINALGEPFLSQRYHGTAVRVIYRDAIGDWKEDVVDTAYRGPSRNTRLAINPLTQKPSTSYYIEAEPGVMSVRYASYQAEPNDAPVVAIAAPTDNDTFSNGDIVPIDFSGTATDTEDGDLTANLTWESDLDGPIGSGGSFSATLSVGYHTITALVADSGGKTGSASVNITVGDPAPAAPTGLAATGGDGFVDLDWDDNTESDLAGYNVYRSTTPADPSPVPIASSVATSDYLDTDVANGTTYYYTVTAVDQGANESPASNEAGATPLADLPPAAPTGLTATGGFGVVNLDWNDNNETDLAGYNVYRSTTPGGSYAQIASLAPNSDYADSAVEGGTAYYYVVTAVDASSQESGFSNEAGATPGAQPTLHVESITMALVKAGKNYKGEATMLVHDSGGAPVQGAAVVGNWLFNGDALDTGVSGATDSAGNAVITSTPVKAGSGDVFTFVITDVALTGYVYDAEANNETQDSIAVP